MSYSTLFADFSIRTFFQSGVFEYFLEICFEVRGANFDFKLAQIPTRVNTNDVAFVERHCLKVCANGGVPHFKQLATQDGGDFFTIHVIEYKGVRPCISQ